MRVEIIWRCSLVMTVAMLSLASCSSDDDSNVYEAAELGGTWQKVYDEGVADAGTVQYTFRPQSANNGTVDIFTSDWAAGDTTVYRIYTVTNAGHLLILPSPMTPQKPSPWIATSAVLPVRRWFGTSPVLMRKYQGSRR